MTLHLSDSQIARLAADDLPAAEAAEIVSHLFTCVVCGKRFDEVLRGGEPTVAQFALEGPFLLKLERLREEAISARNDARSIASELLEQPTQRRQTWVRNSKRLATAEVVTEILRRSRGLVFDDPTEALALASLALEAANLVDQQRTNRDALLAACWTDIANCRRILSDLSGAREALGTASSHLEQDSGEPGTEMRFLEVLSALQWAGHDFGGARRSNARFIRLARDLGEQHQVGRGLMFKGTIDWSEHGKAEAVETIRRGIELLDPDREPKVYFAALQNLIGTLVSLDRLSEARVVIARIKQLPGVTDRGLRLRLLWAEARLDHKAGAIPSSDAAMERVVEGLIEIGQIIPAAQALLELATFHFEARRFAEVRELAARTLPIFKSQGIHREALAAYTLFVQAAEAETLTRSLLAELSHYFGQFRPRDARPFRPGGEGSASPS